MHKQLNMKGIEKFKVEMAKKGYTVSKIERHYNQFYYNITHENGIDDNMDLEYLSKSLGDIIWNEGRSVDEAMKIIVDGLDEFFKVLKDKDYDGK